MDASSVSFRRNEEQLSHKFMKLGYEVGLHPHNMLNNNTVKHSCVRWPYESQSFNNVVLDNVVIDLVSTVNTELEGLLTLQGEPSEGYRLCTGIV